MIVSRQATHERSAITLGAAESRAAQHIAVPLPQLDPRAR